MCRIDLASGPFEALMQAKPKFYQPKPDDGELSSRIGRSIREGTRAPFSPTIGQVVTPAVEPRFARIEGAFRIAGIVHVNEAKDQPGAVEGIYSVEPAGAARQWFVIYTAPLSEVRVSQALVRAGVSHYLPRIGRWKRQSARAKHQSEPKRRITAPLLTRYIFGALPAGRMHFGQITDIDGVHSILSDSAGPIIVREDTVTEIAAREAEGEFDDTKPIVVQTKRGAATVLVPRWVDVGSPVVIKTGPFANFKAKVEEILTSERVKVGLSIFGRRMPIEITIDELGEP